MTKYHVRLSEEMLEGARYAVLPGDPGRVQKTAQGFDPGSKFLAQNREYTSWLGTVSGARVLVCSTGIGGPSTSIAVEELAGLGVKKFVRIGTTGAIQPYIPLGSLIVTTGAVRLDGASTHYAPIEYPAVADFGLTRSLVDAVVELGIPHFVGITASADTFYPGQERYDSFTRYVLRRFQGSLKEWQALNVLNFEMESATLFTMASAMGLKAGCIAGAIVNRSLQESPDDEVLRRVEADLARAVARAVAIDVSRGE